MRLAFAGTPPFAARALEAIAAAGHDVALVLTQPDRPAGRGMRVTSSAVSESAGRLGVPIIKPATLRDEHAVRTLREAQPAVLVVAAYGLLLPPAVLSIPSGGCVNIHASLLPRWRGAAPIQRAILAGDAQTGISIMQMDAGLDTGPVLLQEAMPIDARATSGTLTDALSQMGARLILRALEGLPALTPQPQDATLATLAPKVAKSEALIDWRESSERIDRVIRAFDPAPGAQTQFGNEFIKIWEAVPVAASGAPGAVVEATPLRLVVACGRGALELRRIQKAGGRPMSGADFARGVRLLGTVFGAPSTVR
ncbi:MAG: methionyl-tRNA formyltransferase [Usitatibacter sp.]